MASANTPSSVVPLLNRALHKIRSTPPRIIASPATQPRRAAVALIVRVVPSASSPPLQRQNSTAPTLSEFFELDWVNDPAARAEVLFLRREKSHSDSALENGAARQTEAHVAFPGGRTEDGDEGGLYTAMRQTWEEIGLDLAERDFTCIGQLDDREITTSLGKRLLMILSPFVFLQLTPHTRDMDPAPETTLHWIPLSSIAALDGKSNPRWSHVTVDAASRLAPRHSTFLRLLVRALVGSMQFPAIILESSTLVPHTSHVSRVPPQEWTSSNEKAHSSLPTPAPSPDLDRKRGVVENGGHENGNGNEKQQQQRLSAAPQVRRREELKLWGLSLGMTLDLMSYMSTPDAFASALPFEEDQKNVMGVSMGKGLAPPSLTSVFPRFSYPDVNFWIWVFGKRYREVIRGWEISVNHGGTNDKRINWTGSALNTFYAAVRKALVVVIVARALGILFGLTFTGWWLFIR